MLLEITNFLHLVGLAFGLGGATIAVILSIKADKDADLGKQIMKIIPSISKLIWFGLLLLIISGIALSFIIKWPVDKNLLIIKHILVFLILAFGVIIWARVKKMNKLILLGDKDGLAKTKKQIKCLGMINLILWYLITLLAVFM